MKNTNYFMMLFIALSITFTACNDDNDNITSGNNDLANAQNAKEENEISLSDINLGIEIDGATKKNGLPPNPTGNVDFKIDAKIPGAFLNNGFNIQFSSTSNIKGAYIVFKEKNGKVADSYFDVPVSVFNTVFKNGNNKSNRNNKKPLFKGNTKTTSNNNYIDVNFNAAIPPGEFCYDICLYDTSNNISSIESVCVTVQAWGGNANIVGSWEYVLEDQDTEEFPCDNGQTISIHYSESILNSEIIFNINEDGSFALTAKQTYRDIDYQATYENCSISYDGTTYKEDSKSTGYWAYNEDNETMTAVEFTYKDFIDPEYNETFENGYLLFEGLEVEILNGQLLLTETYIENGITTTETLRFNRK